MKWTTRLFNTGYIAAALCAERRIPFVSSKWIKELQEYRLRCIIRHAYDTVPFYRRIMDEKGLKPRDFKTVTDLNQLPLINGKLMSNHPDDFVSSSYREASSRQTFYSSGTQSHVRRVIHVDNFSVLLKLARNERDRIVLCHLVGKNWGQRQVYISPPPSQEPGPDRKIQDYWAAGTFLRNAAAERHSIPMDLSFEEITKRIVALKPQVVFSYGSYIDEFFRYLSERQLKIELPKVWVYGADMLSPGGKDLIENDFGCYVYSIYQSTETGRLGFQCERRQGLHLNIDLCAVRLVNANGEDSAPGEIGEVVISNLYNRAMVLLNYKMDDLGSLAVEPCPCGRSLPVLNHLEGRRSDLLELPGNRSMSALTLEGYCRHELKPTLQVQIQQFQKNEITWRIVPFSDTNLKELQRQLIEKTCSVVGENVKVDVEFVPDIPRTPQGKFQKVLSNQTE